MTTSDPSPTPATRTAPDSQPGRHAAAMMAMARALAARTRSPQSAYRELTQTCARGLAVDRCSLWRFEGLDRVLRLVDLYDAQSDGHVSGTVLDAGKYPEYFRELWSGRLIAADDALVDPRTYEFRSSYLEPLGIVSMLDVPLRSQQGLLGVLCNEHRQARSWEPSDIRMASFTACLATVVMDGLERQGG